MFITTNIRKIFLAFDIEISRPRNAFKDMQSMFGATTRPTILDVGAHVGQTSNRFRKLFPYSQIYAIEPFPESFRLCKSFFKQDLKTKVVNMALSNIDGRQLLHANSSPQTNSILKTDPKAAEIWGSNACSTRNIIEVQSETLDTFLDREKIDKVDILKLDVQGAEHLVMEGAKYACKQKAIRAIYAEIITQPTYENQARLDEALKMYFECGFELFNTYNHGYTNSGRLCQIDALFIKS